MKKQTLALSLLMFAAALVAAGQTQQQQQQSQQPQRTEAQSTAAQQQQPAQAAQPTPEQAEELPPIRNFLRVNKDFCTGGQPRNAHLARLKAEGVRAVINLRPPSEHRAAEEEAAAKELGLRYFNIPVVYTDPKDEQVAEFLRLTDDRENRPAFVHCAGAIRVGAFWMIRRVLRDGWTVEAAEEEARKIGLRESPHLVEFARSYIARHGKAKK